MMNDMNHPIDDRFFDLLSKKVTEGLTASEQQEFERLDWASHSLDPELETLRFESAATALDQAISAGVEAEPSDLPADLHAKLLVSAGKFLASPPDAESLSTAPAAEDQHSERVVRRSVVAPPTRRETLAILAAAACLVLLVGNNAGLFEPKSSPVAQMRSFEKARPTDMVKVDWTGVQNKNVTGVVKWSDQHQEGYMVFDGLPVNDPSVEQYQLWIFDTDADQPVPTDGGVFDIKSDGTSVVRIAPQHPVKKAVMFAVTIEQPGGVQISDRKRLPVLAKIAP